MDSGSKESVMECLLRDVRIGDLVELYVDGKFFQRQDDCDEKYAGYVCALDDGVISLSPTHHINKNHGYVEHNHPYKNDGRNRVFSSIELAHVRKYRIIP